MEVHVEVFHGVDPDVIYDETPYLCFCHNIGLLHQILMLRGGEGATLQHIANLLADLAIVFTGQSVPKLLLCGFQLLFHSQYLRCPDRGDPGTASLVREV